MKRAKTKPTLRWPYVVALFLIFGMSIILRAAEVVGPKLTPYSAHPLDDDVNVRLVAIQKNFNSLAQAPRVQITLAGTDIPSLRYLVLIDAGDNYNNPEIREQLHYFESTMTSVQQAKQKVATNEQPSQGLEVPILMYHRTPDNFEQQIRHLSDRGYNSITLEDLRLALTAKYPLPTKPIIITLDDGYTDQLREIDILKKYRMKATLYMINGGAASKWCIGANAKKGPDCESYLAWDELRQIDKEGLITIGSHTINHPNLATLSIDQQRAEIIGGKQELEKQLGHAINDFAYPYGSFNETSIQVVKEAGFLTAVTTQPGTTHTAAGLFTLTRVRDALILP